MMASSPQASNNSITRRFKQVDVFTKTPLLGNPLAVILDSDGLTDAQMQGIARWTNLSETTFVLPPTEPSADYRVRIFTTDRELPFAGHPTLGTAHALLENGLATKQPNKIVQQCGAGLVEIAIAGETVDSRTLSFRSPACHPAALEDPAQIKLLTDALVGVEVDNTVAPMSALIGLNWLVVRLRSVEDVLAFRPIPALIKEVVERLNVGGIAIYSAFDANQLMAFGVNYELRTFFIEQDNLIEDPVTGSANACLARVLQEQGFPDHGTTAKQYMARQGTLRNREGRILVTYFDGEPWIGGQSVTLINGTIKI
ncbi:hypothetical protein SAMD00019534_005670 [Acytostelium subglobosum LB1]|uniref:hypothetical protein n=1 Tax=Acytostelium subglobosum LB1 TaxID=1410327 RepID=UPI000644C239|nr:hypothetical protein SAMD00019534_005670 [Acytostelium subglobosum LB1]GAM17392.1 hypothetical protein SAMD00019534_005670 [Acytostelium subglobosum LB1]|eukprot:XP_012759454.1 hypothetical protein SAMD00019534_005670 [Acytostelium subglobosum LB1]